MYIRLKTKLHFVHTTGSLKGFQKLNGFSLAQHYNFFSPRTFSSNLKVSSPCSTPFFYSSTIFSRKQFSTSTSPTNEIKTLPVTVEYEGNKVTFDIPTQNYTISQLLEDTKKFWNLRENKEDSPFQFQHAKTGSILPHSSLVSGVIDPNFSYIKLFKPQPLRSIPLEEGIQSEKILETEEEEEDDQFMDSTNHLVNYLSQFHKSKWVRRKMNELGLFELTQQKFDSALVEFDKAIQGNPSHPVWQLITSLSKKEFVKEAFPLFLKYLKKEFKKESKQETEIIEQVTDLTSPKSWYKATMSVKRTIVLHLGPTNSGKTHAALTKLSEAGSGIYLGPLRLLAHEIYERLNESNVPCSLLTGQQKIEKPDAKHISCTVEMADLNRVVDVAVVDEIQMIASRDRGYAWTRALLGLQAREVHLCGDESSLSIVKELCADETIIVNNYKRLSPLKVLSYPIKNPLTSLSKGDCIICFSKKEIFEMKKQIESNTKLKCCIIYGALPPEARSQQAALFNDPNSKFDILIASDAIGMGLNLNIKRIIFSTLVKYDGIETRTLTDLEIKQIAGRAGRYRSIFPVGHVTSFNGDDLFTISHAITSKVEPIKHAGLFPTYEQIELFSRFNPAFISFSNLLDRFFENASLDKNFFICNHDDIKTIAKLIESVPLSLKDRYTFSLSPVDSRSSKAMSFLLVYAMEYSAGSQVQLRISIDHIKDMPSFRTKIEELETVHHIADLYLWLACRFDNFSDSKNAVETKLYCNREIGKALTKVSKDRSKSRLEEKMAHLSRRNLKMIKRARIKF